MTVIRDYFNSFKTAEFVEAIRSLPLQYGYINSLNLFDMKSTGQSAVVFDKDETTVTLLPQVKRGDKAATQGGGRRADTFALSLAYFKHGDRLTGEDIQGHRQVGSDMQETLARATAEKLADMRLKWDQTKEYMQLQAMKGVFKTPDGTVVADMFSEFNETQIEVDFLLGTSTTNLDGKIAELKRQIAKNVKNGGAIGGVEVLVDPTFFERLVNHAQIKNAYQFYQNSGKQALRDDLAEYMKWGIMDHFEHRGVNFVSYDATFNLPDGTTEVAFAENTGLAVAKGVRDLFRGYWGPSNKLSAANEPGQEIFFRSYADERDEFVDLELESAPLFVATKPKSLIKVKSSN